MSFRHEETTQILPVIQPESHESSRPRVPEVAGGQDLATASNAGSSPAGESHCCREVAPGLVMRSRHPITCPEILTAAGWTHVAGTWVHKGWPDLELDDALVEAWCPSTLLQAIHGAGKREGITIERARVGSFLKGLMA